MGSQREQARRRQRALGIGLVAASAAVLIGCATDSINAAAPSADRCIAECSKPSANGEACLEWAALASSACVSRYSAVDQCCGPGGRALCPTSTAMSVGTACVCRGVDRHGPFVVQGSACRPG